LIAWKVATGKRAQRRLKSHVAAAVFKIPVGEKGFA